ncbi:hypothetical protein C427_1673 [Paraglaciecola psychrophila 170]|uniref:Uncharacterized protein n=1 Tax=Paraglaciecola psychrophila 170 TaxID=1129794 RepID=K6Z6C2_9ALTE|nr:hypothetical protein C427_1673 [Paraglaciecola psychrophila 170]GAC40634.1 hypothetical protein GPSY_5035 [Paraglaciecola psychrophila 170]
MPDLNNLPDTHFFLTFKNTIMREQQTNSLLIQSGFRKTN